MERETPRPLLLISPVRRTDNETGGLLRKLEARPPRSPALRKNNVAIGIYQVYIKYAENSYDEISLRSSEERTQQRKARIDFEEAKALWDDPIVIEAPSNNCGEQR